MHQPLLNCLFGRLNGLRGSQRLGGRGLMESRSFCSFTPFGYDIERAGEKFFAGCVAAGLAAGSFGQRRGADEDDGINLKLMATADGLPDVVNEGERVKVAARGAFDFLNNHKPLSSPPASTENAAPESGASAAWLCWTVSSMSRG